ncbi:hypothetical protein ACH4TV_17785 [Streptomyces sp. NPDC020898]|uniref:hypothetical protein n=1 Tax=Streptomyces sp. NPDC020898 TaxID=3365101 RepID=UPI0037B2DF33
MVDQLAVANWMFATVNRDEDTDPAPYPEPLPRPDGGAGPSPAATGEPVADLAATGEERSASPAEIVAFLSSPG